MTTSCFDQSILLGTELKGQEPRGSRIPQCPTPLIENPLSFDPNSLPGLDTYTGKISRYLQNALILATGRLTVPHTYQSAVLKKVGGKEMNRRLVNIATSSDPSIFSTIPDATILREDGQAYRGELYQLNPIKNGNILAGATAFVESFSDMPDELLKTWVDLTGQKIKTQSNISDAVTILKFFGNDPNRPFPLSTFEFPTKEDNPYWQPLRRMRDYRCFVEIDPTCKDRHGNILTDGPILFNVPQIYKSTAVDFGKRIKKYEERVQSIVSDGELGETFDTIRNSTDNRYGETILGLRSERIDLISKALKLYTLINTYSQRHFQLNSE